MSTHIPAHFRQSMAWLHTWVGIALAGVLFAIFWTGSLSVFNKEIDKWMKPELRIATPETAALDELVLPQLSALDPMQGSAVWIGRPSERHPAIEIYYKDAEGISHEVLLDPRTGERLNLTDSHAGEFFFRFHFMLHMPSVLGYWIVAIAAMGMMVLVTSGIFIHRKIFQDFFTFRPQKKTRRATLDFHNVTAVIALPFHFLLPFTGLLIMIAAYFPWSLAVPFGGDLEKLEHELAGYEHQKIEPAGVTGPPIESVDDFVARAEAIWSAEEGNAPSRADWVAIFNFNDAKAYVVVERYFASQRVAIGPHQVVFDPQTEEIIDQFKPRPVHYAANWLEGLHWIQFDHWLLCWLYFFAGLSGCAMIASGLLFWMHARIKIGQYNPVSIRVVRAIGVGSTTGIIISSGAFLISNRLMPKDFALDGLHRHDLEYWAFFTVWIAAFIHAAMRGKSAWYEQSYGIAIMATTAVLLNWFTTGHHIWAAANASLWSIATMDVVLISISALAVWAATRLRKTARLQVGSTPQSDAVPPLGRPAE